MWPFKRKKINKISQTHAPKCSHCQGTNTKVITNFEAEQPDCLRVWRGKRYLTCRCLDCGLDFYAELPAKGLPHDMIDDQLIADEEALRAAEEELKKQVQEEGDLRCH